MHLLPLIVPLFLGAADDPGDEQRTLAEAARSQIGVTLRYDASYVRMKVPGGDVPQEFGCCTDVVIRAYRKVGVDLQVLVNRDLVAAWSAYSHGPGQTKPDPNIDHRRVLTLATFFKRRGASLPVTRKPQDYLPGDLVTWKLREGIFHIGVLSAGFADGHPLVIHNLCCGVKEEDILFAPYPITGHFRFHPATAGNPPRSAP
jgi:uncharacterized protein YijF (DUF1287 family)